MAYFLVHRSEWRLIEASDQLEAMRGWDKAVRMHSETECVAGVGTLRGSIAASTWDEAWKEAEGILMR
jgi:hypothetical protein